MDKPPQTGWAGAIGCGVSARIPINILSLDLSHAMFTGPGLLSYATIEHDGRYPSHRLLYVCP